jgi:hypothetical protein
VAIPPMGIHQVGIHQADKDPHTTEDHHLMVPPTERWVAQLILVQEPHLQVLPQARLPGLPQIFRNWKTRSLQCKSEGCKAIPGTVRQKPSTSL